VHALWDTYRLLCSTDFISLSLGLQKTALFPEENKVDNNKGQHTAILLEVLGRAHDRDNNFVAVKSVIIVIIIRSSE